LKRSFGIARSQVTRDRSDSTKSLPDPKVSYVVRLFSDGTREYDFLLKILSLGRDRHWRGSLLREAGVRKGDRVLDIACGTGLVSYSFAGMGATVVGIDVTREMIRTAMDLPEYRRGDVDFIVARAENLPLRSDSFDASTISLALRNVSSQVETLGEMSRCTKSGRRVISLDFSRPTSGFFRPFYDFYIFKVLPALGLIISFHWNTIFLYLANSIEKSRNPEDIQMTMDSIGLKGSGVKRMTFGVTAIVSGMKP
jgi:demethylmenaquinone methyltransferase / 2-methoxy-6-polyprenyl-1,4-benzoquinol methylase